MATASPGTAGNNERTITIVQGSAISGAVTANQVLALWGPSPVDAHITGIQAYADVAGTGGGNTVLDILINGNTIWSVRAGDKPTLAALSTGAFALSPPVITTLQQGDRINMIVSSISSTGHASVRMAMTLERPAGSAG